jgi:hypothetical protein
MLRYYTKQITNVDPLEPKFMEFAYTGKINLTLMAQRYILHL